MNKSIYMYIYIYVCVCLSVCLSEVHSPALCHRPRQFGFTRIRAVSRRACKL